VKLVKLGNLASIQTGKIDVNKAVVGGKYPFFTCSRDVYEINDAPFEGKAVLVAGNGDLNVKYYEGKFNAYQRTYFLFVNNEDELLPRYLYWFLESYIGQLRSEAIGSTIKYIKMGNLTDAEIPLPPLEKQLEIVEKLDSAFADIEAVGEGMTSRIKNTSELFAKICLEKTQDLNPTGFKSLKEIATVITKGTTPTSLGFKFTSAGINFLKVESLDDNGGFVGSKFAYIDSACHESLKRSQLVESDVLVSIAGALGRTAIVTADICPANVNQALSLIRIPKNSEVSPKFLFALFQAGYFKFELDQMGAGAAQQNLSLAQIGSLKVPIFSESKQIEFIEFLNNLRGLVTDLKNQLEKQYLLKLELQKSILTTTFSYSTDNELVA